MSNIITNPAKMCIPEEIVTSHKYNALWYIKRKKTSEKPSSYAIKESIDKGNQFIVSRQIEKNRLYSSYNTPETVVNTINEYGNIHMYELLTPSQPVNLYLDIEFPAAQLNPQSALITIIYFMKKILIEIFGKNNAFDDEDIYISGSIGTGNLENVEVEKASYHIILQCQQCFKCVADLKKFMNYVRFRIDNPINDEEKEEIGNLTYILNDNIKRVIDFHVYGSNQCMKLPCQSKYGSDRVQQPLFKKDNLLNHFCGNYEDVEYLEFFDISKIPQFEITQDVTNRKTLLGSSTSYITTSNIHADFRPRECIPDAVFRPHELVYIMNSIDNTDQDYTVYIGIACALKNCCRSDKEGLDLFIKWCEKSSKYEIEQTITTWNSLERREKGYNIGTLIKVATRCNPKISKKRHANDFIRPLVHTDPIFNTYVYNERYVQPYDYQKYECIICESPMGTGKTFQIAEMLNKMDLENLRILILAPRRCFAKSICGELNIKHGFNFTCYLDIKDKKVDLHKVDHLVCQMESLHYLKATYDIIIADECVSCLSQFSSTETMKGKIDRVSASFENIWKNAKFKLVCDAFIDPKTLKFIEHMDKKVKKDNILDDCFAGVMHTPYDHIQFVKNEYIPEEREAFELKRYKDPDIGIIDNLQTHLLKSLRSGKKCIFVTASKQRGDEFLIKLQRTTDKIKYKFYNSSSPNLQEDLSNVNESWKELDLLMYTSSITVGVNFDIEHFDLLYMYSSCKSSCVRDMFQASMRCRHIKDNIMYYCLFDRAFGLDLMLPKDHEEIKDDIIRKSQREGTFETQLSEINTSLTKWKRMPKWLFDVHSYNIYEKNISIRHHRMLFYHYLNRCNYINNKTLKVEEIPAELAPVNFCPYNYITYNVHDIIILEEKVNNNRQILTDEERNKWQKYQFDKQVEDHKDKALMYDHFFNPSLFKRSNYFNLLYEKRYALDKLSEKDKKDRIFSEMSSERALKLKSIREILGILGVKSTTDIQVFNDYDIVEKYDQVIGKREEWFKIFGLRDQQSKLTSLTKFKQIYNTINVILNEWVGNEVSIVQNKRSKRKINNKWVNFASYRLLPPINLDIVNMFRTD